MVMGGADIPLLNLAERRLAWTDQRQQILAQNIANADTPGFLSRDLTPFAAQLAQAGFAPARTDPRHLPGSAGTTSRPSKAQHEHAPDGNGVKLDEELTKVADTESTHDLTGDLYKKYLGFFKIAIGR